RPFSVPMDSHLLYGLSHGLLAVASPGLCLFFRVIFVSTSYSRLIALRRRILRNPTRGWR
ncbi:hypothetical protein NDU88_008374, partial [Pleurodeles waltl]